MVSSVVFFFSSHGGSISNCSTHLISLFRLCRVEIQRLEASKTELQNRIAEEVETSKFSLLRYHSMKCMGSYHANQIFSLQAKGNTVLQASLERRKKALHERRLALEQDVRSILEIL